MSRAACLRVQALGLTISSSDDDDISEADAHMNTGSPSLSSFSSHSSHTSSPSSFAFHSPPSPNSTPPYPTTPPALSYPTSPSRPSSPYPCTHHRSVHSPISSPHPTRRFHWSHPTTPRRARRTRVPASVAEATQQIVVLHRRLARNAERTAELTAQQREAEDDATDAGLRGCVLERAELYLLVHLAHMDFVQVWDVEIMHRHQRTTQHKRAKLALPLSPPHSTSPPAYTHRSPLETVLEAESDS